MSKEEAEVRHYKVPSAHRLLFKRRVFEIEEWAAKEGLIEGEAVLQHIEKRYGLEREQAQKYLAEVLKDFQRLGRVYGGGSK